MAKNLSWTSPTINAGSFSADSNYILIRSAYNFPKRTDAGHDSNQPPLPYPSGVSYVSGNLKVSFNTTYPAGTTFKITSNLSATGNYDNSYIARNGNNGGSFDLYYSNSDSPGGTNISSNVGGGYFKVSHTGASYSNGVTTFKTTSAAKCLYIYQNSGGDHCRANFKVNLSYVAYDVSATEYTNGSTGSAGGSVSGAGEFVRGSNVTLTASTNDGYTFKGWYSSAAGAAEGGTTDRLSTATTYTISSISADKSVYASFFTEYDISTSASPAEGGTVSGGGSYITGSTATVTAATNFGYMFIGWFENGSRVSSLPSYSFTADSNRTLEARWIKVNYRSIIGG